jgi:hypothetical protein
MTNKLSLTLLYISCIECLASVLDLMNFFLHDIILYIPKIFFFNIFFYSTIFIFSWSCLCNDMPYLKETKKKKKKGASITLPYLSGYCMFWHWLTTPWALKLMHSSIFMIFILSSGAWTSVRYKDWLFCAV